MQIGLVLGTAAFLLVSQLPEDVLESWGWRVPFLLSFLMIFVTLYFRLRVEESPVFDAAAGAPQVVKLPILDTVKRYPRSVLVGIGAHVADIAVIYIFVTFSVAYATDELGLSRTDGAARRRHRGADRDRASAALRRALGPDRPAPAQPLQRLLHGALRVPVLAADQHRASRS